MEIARPKINDLIEKIEINFSLFQQQPDCPLFRFGGGFYDIDSRGDGGFNSGYLVCLKGFLLNNPACCITEYQASCIISFVIHKKGVLGAEDF